MLVVAPIGLWMSGAVLDAVGGERSASPARRLIGLGAVAAVPAAATGAADWRDTRSAEQRLGTVHALVNNAAMLTFVGSWAARVAGRDRLGRTLSRVGLVGVAIAGYLGGHLAYVRGVGVNTTAFQSGPQTA
jgi:uncharacterized membrane protein